MKIKVTAIEPCNSYRPGDTFDVSEREADALEAKGLVKRAPTPKNKQAIPSENKADPSAAAGEGATSSASRAAQASRRTTARQSARGAGTVEKDA